MLKARRRLIWSLLIVLVLGFVGLDKSHAEEFSLEPETATQESHILAAYSQLPIYFEANQGQTSDQVRYMARTSGYTLFLTDQQAVFSLKLAGVNSASEDPTVAGTYGLRLNFKGANPHPSLIGEAQQEGISSYFTGSRDEWHTNIAHYGQVRYQDLYEGIDAIFYGNPQRLQYDFEVAPHADVSQIQLAFDPVENLTLTSDGNLLLNIGAQELTMHAPYSYQIVDGVEVEVESRFVVSEGTVSFALGSYDRRLPLTIDPVLVYASFVGGTANDIAYGVDVDSSGNAYIVGLTTSQESSFPVTVGPDLTWNGNFGGDAFIMKLNPSGTGIIYAGYIGGSGADSAYSVAVDGSGNAYVTGSTSSSEATFPVSGGPVTTYPGSSSAFIAKVIPSGASLDYVGYIAPGTGRGIDVDASGNAYVTGGFGSSMMVYKVNAAGTGFTYSYTVGTGTGQDVVVDASNNAYVTGQIGTDAVVAKLNTAGSGTDYQVALGGSGTDNGLGIAVDGGGNAYVAGDTTSTDFPTVGSLDNTYNGSTRDGFIAKLGPTGSTVYAAYIGGSSFDAANDVVVDSSGNAYVGGQTSSTEATFPVVGGPDLTKNGNNGGDAFVMAINSDGTGYLYSGFIGGAKNENGYTIAIDTNRNVYIVGVSASNDGTFPDGDGPGSVPGYAPNYIGGFNGGFIAKVMYPLLVEFSTATDSASEGNSGSSGITSPTLLVSGGNLTSAITVDILLTDGTATAADNDYTQTSATVTIPAADYSTVQSISIPSAAFSIVGDVTDESDETLTLSFQNLGTGLGVGDANGDLTTNSANVFTILNDDSTTFNVEFSAATGSGSEGDSGTAAVTSPTLLVSGGVLASDSTIELALTDGTATTADSDYNQTSATITIPAADYTTAQSVAIPAAALSIVGDTTDEGDETLNLALQNPGAGLSIGDADADTTTNSTAVYTILNDDGVSFNVEFSATAGSGSEGSSGTSFITSPTLLVSGGVLASPSSIDLALTDGTATTADSDYSQTSATITIPAADYTTVQSIAIPVTALGIVGDTVVEPDEVLGLTLQNPGSGFAIGDADGDTSVASTAVYTILDDDGVPSSSGGSSGASASIGVFDPAISKLGFLVPGQTGVAGEQLEWMVTVTNKGGVAGTNVVVSDTINTNLRVRSVEVPDGVTSSINGQQVTVTIPVLNPGQSVNFSIFTTVIQGQTVENTACLVADNYQTPLCSTGTAVNQLPSTGESPWSQLRAVGMSFLGVFALFILHRVVQN